MFHLVSTTGQNVRGTVFTYLTVAGRKREINVTVIASRRPWTGEYQRAQYCV